MLVFVPGEFNSNILVLFVCLFICWVIYFQSQKYQQFLRWLQLLADYLRNIRKRDSYHSAQRATKKFAKENVRVFKE